MLLTVHVAAAGVLKTPELALDPSEAKQLAKAMDDVNKAFPSNIDPRMVVILNATAVAAMIYGPRIVTIRDRLKTERKQTRKSGDVISPTGETVPNAAPYSFEPGAFSPAKSPQPAPPEEPPFSTSKN